MKTYTIASLALVVSLSVIAPSANAGDFQHRVPSVVPARMTNSLLARAVPGKRLYLLPAYGASRTIYGYYDAKLPVADHRGIIQTRVPVKFVKIEKPVYRYRFVRRMPGQWITIHPGQGFRAGNGVWAACR
jgi:hypothetical protein